MSRKLTIEDFLKEFPDQIKNASPRKVRDLLRTNKLKGVKEIFGPRKQPTWFVLVEEEGEEAPPENPEERSREGGKIRADSPYEGSSDREDIDSSGGDGDRHGTGEGSGGDPGDPDPSLSDSPRDFVRRIADAEAALGIDRGVKSRPFVTRLLRKGEKCEGDTQEKPSGTRSSSRSGIPNEDARVLSEILRTILEPVEPWKSASRILTSLWFDCTAMILEGWGISARNSKWWGFLISSAGIFGRKLFDKIRSRGLHRKREEYIPEVDSEEDSLRQTSMDLHSEEERRVPGEGDNESRDDGSIDLPEY